jgi:hypothetical protein
MIKTVVIFFRDPRIQMVEHLDKINEAVDHAERNLCARHNVKIQGRGLYGNGYAIGLDIPSDSDFNIGQHLRGLSLYLLKKYSSIYSPMKQGTSLLSYHDANNVIVNVSDMSPNISNLRKSIDEVKEALSKLEQAVVYLERAENLYRKELSN